MPEEATGNTMTYGRSMTMSGVRNFLLLEFKLNRKNFAEGKRRRVPCIWGPPGVGKTDIVKGFVADGYKIKSVPLAQFEEMGDLNGIPQERQDANGQWGTYMCPPEWAPNLERDGEKVILLLDDFNRADPRIVKGTMQLIQDYGMVAWSLDQPDWHIVCTANPEGGLNDVTPLDPAQVSRFTHATLEIKAEEGARDWASWADRTGIDKRAITFVLMNPKHLFTGRDRVNPRTWTQAFDILSEIPQIPGQTLDKKSGDILQSHIEACVDKEAASAFFSFMTRGLLEMVEPEEILDDLEKVMPKLRKLSGLDSTAEKKSVARNDCLFAIMERLYLFVRSDLFTVKPGDEKTAIRAVNFCKVIAGELAGTDMRWAIIRRLYWSDGEAVAAKMTKLVDIAKEKDKAAASAVTKMLVTIVS